MYVCYFNVLLKCALKTAFLFTIRKQNFVSVELSMNE